MLPPYFKKQKYSMINDIIYNCQNNNKNSFLFDDPAVLIRWMVFKIYL